MSLRRRDDWDGEASVSYTRCSVPDCGKPVKAVGLCNAHYLRKCRHGDPLAGAVARPRDLDTQFWAKVAKSEECWTWTGRVSNWGYGYLRRNGKTTYVHCLSYELHVGGIPTGYEVDHLCLNKRCVNPRHLEAVTAAENRRREQARKTTCPAYHEYDRVIHRSDGRIERTCSICSNSRRRNASKGAWKTQTDAIDDQADRYEDDFWDRSS